MEKNKYGFAADRANLKFTNNIMLCCSNDDFLTVKYFSRNKHGSLQKARDTMNSYMRSEHKEKNHRRNL